MVAGTNKVYSMPLFLTMSHCCEMDWDLFFSQMDSGLISHHWSSRVQITFAGKIKIVSWIILKCTNPLSWYIASVRLESFIGSKRERSIFKKKRSVVCWPYFSLSFLYSTLHCVISSNCFLCFRTKNVIMTWWVLFSDCAWLRLAGVGALTFVFSQLQTWPGNSCVTSQPWSEQRRDEEWSVNLKTDFIPWLSVEGSEGSLLLVLSAPEMSFLLRMPGPVFALNDPD